MRNIDQMTNAQLDRLAERLDSNAQIGLDIVCMDEIAAKPIEWLWDKRIAVGKMAIIAGDGGIGKSTILCDIAARVTNGDKWPDGAPATAAGDVIILAAEDDAADTLKPRLLAAGAAVSRVFNIRAAHNDDKDKTKRGFNLQLDLDRLEKVITQQERTRLVIIDPISSYLGKVDSHKNADVRAILEPFGEMANRCGVAVLVNNHFSKGGGSANNRMIGSVAFVNYARGGFIVTPDPEDESRKLFLPSKTNIGPPMDGLAYRIESAFVSDGGQEILTSRIAWESAPVSITADAALAAHDNSGDRAARQEAEDALQELLRDGPKPATEVKAETTAAGLSWATVRRAQRQLGIVSERKAMEGQGIGAGGRWEWSLPPKVLKSPYDAHLQDVSTLGESEHLRGSKVPDPAEGAHFKNGASSDPEGIFGEEILKSASLAST